MEAILFSVFALFVLGLCFGSFGTVLLDRLPRGESIGGRSRCVHCRMVIGWRNLLPVISYLLLHGRCRKCQGQIPLAYPALEIASGILFVSPFILSPDHHFSALLLGVALWLLLLIAVADLQTQLVPDVLSLSFIGFAFLYSFVEAVPPWGGVALALFFFGAQWILSSGRWIGTADILVATGIGVLFGTWQLAALAIGLAYIFGASIALILLGTGMVTRKSHLPFTPFLGAGAFFTLFFGETLLHLFGA
jgi:leader peptidase (prepilin peptidase) / N-methyltransferase